MPIIIEGPDGAGKSTLAKSPAVEKFSAHIPEVGRIAMSSDEPKHDIAAYRFDNGIVTEVKDED